MRRAYDELPFEGAQAALHRAGVAEDEARQETEDRVVDLAALGDRDACAGAFGRELDGPRAAERLIGIGNPRDEARRNDSLINFHHHRAAGHVLAKAHATAVRRQHLDSRDLRPPVRVAFDVTDRRVDVGRRSGDHRVPRGGVRHRQQIADDGDDGDERQQGGECPEEISHLRLLRRERPCGRRQQRQSVERPRAVRRRQPRQHRRDARASRAPIRPASRVRPGATGARPRRVRRAHPSRAR